MACWPPGGCAKFIEVLVLLSLQLLYVLGCQLAVITQQYKILHTSCMRRLRPKQRMLWVQIL